MAEKFPDTRTEAPAYLARYLNRKKTKSNLKSQKEGDDSSWVFRAREKAEARARVETEMDEAPPVRTEGYARVTVSPRELIFPDSFRERMNGTTDVRLIRHGQTQGYGTNAGLTQLGKWQSHRKGQNLARGLKDGSKVVLINADTARARETATGVQEGLMQGIARYKIENIEIIDPFSMENFRNLQVWCDGEEKDPTSAFVKYDTVLEEYERKKSGDRPGWLDEIDRFWKVQAGGGDPIAYWLNQPLQYFEPPAIVVRRFWRGIVKTIKSNQDNDNLRVFVCTHSGAIRAVATSAVGHDPGEPHNLEDVRIRVFSDMKNAIITYRGRGTEIEIPTINSPTWYDLSNKD
ncbi:MAG: histidine phosphatase family protein [Candidatus Marinimicrobia bacterium]|nr:histidine phosphatase family protein [Candidatus Neomarinimicrobiota bacterium]